MHGKFVYHCNKQASNVLLSIQFDTNVSQLLRRVLPWSYDPLPSLGDLSSSSLNRLSVCLSCLFCLCIPPVVYGRPIPPLPPSGPVFRGNNRGFFIFSKKMGKLFFKKKWPDVRPDERLTSGVRRQSPTPPDGLTSGATTKVGKKVNHSRVESIHRLFLIICCCPREWTQRVAKCAATERSTEMQSLMSLEGLITIDF
jgi:hypothetical protein